MQPDRGRILFQRLHDHLVANHGDVQLDTARWELYCLEHGILHDGQLPSDKAIGGRDDACFACSGKAGVGESVPNQVAWSAVSHCVSRAIQVARQRLL